MFIKQMQGNDPLYFELIHPSEMIHYYLPNTSIHQTKTSIEKTGNAAKSIGIVNAQKTSCPGFSMQNRKMRL
jgi:hypothetical protein